MTEQISLDLNAGRQARDLALAQVDRNADDEWRDHADRIIAALARTGHPFITDDVWSEGLPPVRENRAIGARMQAAARAGLIVPTGEWRPSAIKTSHAVPRRVWRGNR